MPPEASPPRAAARRYRRLLAFSRHSGTLGSHAALLAAAARVATPARELLLTTVKMDKGGVQLQLLRQWECNLRARAANILLVGTDERTCTLARNASLPCFVDALVQPAGAASAASVASAASAKKAKEVNTFGPRTTK